MILAILVIKPLTGKKKEVLDIFQSMTENLNVKHGCMGARVYVSHGKEERILYMEHWAERELFHRHVQSDLYLRILAAMELSEVTPQVQFHEFYSLQGIELIRTLRRSSE